MSVWSASVAVVGTMAATIWAHQLAWPRVGSEVDPSSGPSADLSCRASQKAAAQTQAELHGLNSNSTFRNEVAGICRRSGAWDLVSAV